MPTSPPSEGLSTPGWLWAPRAAPSLGDDFPLSYLCSHQDWAACLQRACWARFLLSNLALGVSWVVFWA